MEPNETQSTYSVETVKDYMRIASAMGGFLERPQMGPHEISFFKELDYHMQNALYKEAKTVPEEIRDEQFNKAFTKLENILGISSDGDK